MGHFTTSVCIVNRDYTCQSQNPRAEAHKDKALISQACNLGIDGLESPKGGTGRVVKC